MNDEKVGKAEEATRSFQLPWSRKGWYTDEYYASRDRELDAKVEKSGRCLNPYGYYTDRPGLAISPLMHNPYFGFPLAAILGWLTWFVSTNMADTPWLTIPLVVLFGLVAILTVVMSAFRIPGWHRARKIATAYVVEHGGEFPPELRWYT